ncbi:50S ribosomal protein L15 [Candidatus Pelagibacter sp.]|nr:50S ribosomal protein L15 [Candidatus Pelagibacter sp.]
MLNNLKKIKQKKIRVGRGIGSGKGKTCGRGVKGQKSRSGVAIKSFEGGQMPLYRRLPKRGFNIIPRKKIGALNLAEIQSFLQSKKIKSTDKIDLALLKKLNIIKKKYKKLKVLGKGEIKEKLNLEVNYLSNSAKSKLEKTGSNIKIINK